MNQLVTNLYEYTIDVYPKYVKNPDSVAAVLADLFKKDKNHYISLMHQKIESMFTLDKISGVTDTRFFDTLKCEGVIFQKTPYTYYNYGSLASQIIGYTDKSNEGASGIELAYDDELSGTTGLLIYQRDGKGNKRPFTGFSQKYPVAGDNIVLSLDINIQKIVEEELAKGVNKVKSKGGRALVISVNTGEILAMSSYPTFDPNSKKIDDANFMLNRVISDKYEPGSVYKLISIAGAIEENLVNKETVVNTENGEWRLSENRVITDEHKAPSMSVEQVIEFSSNIGTGKIARMLGSQKQYEFARKFGLGTFSGIETINETRGFVKHPSDYKFASLEWIAMGYEVAVNFLQISMAYSAVANNGMLMKPILVKKTTNSNGKVIQERTPVPIRQVISPKTSRTLVDCFRKVVENGTGTEAKLDKINIAGKTGTTQRTSNKGSSYSEQSHNSSFIGFFPVEKPTLLVAGFMDEMDNTKEFFGGKVAAPIFKNISERIIDYIGINSIFSPDMLNENFDKVVPVSAGVNNNNDYFEMPDFTNMELKNVKAILSEHKINLEVEGENKSGEVKGVKYIVTNQFPNAGEKFDLVKHVNVKLKVKNLKSDKPKNLVPKVLNMSIRKAVNTLVTEGYTVEIEGNGVVDMQIPECGNELSKGSKVKIICKNTKDKKN